jgi:multisubunit Na+/H+ antiporter MnhC subunit
VTTWFNYSATLKILVFGLLIGAVLPALFALGVRVGAAGAGISGDAVTQRRPVLTALSWLLYALVLTAAVIGVLFIARDFIALHTGWFILGAKPT